MKVQSKFYIFIISSTVLMSVLFTISSSYMIREFTIAKEREHGKLGAQIVKNELLLRLMQNDINRDKLLTSLRVQIPELLYVDIIRGPNVISQFGTSSQILNDEEQQALDDKRSFEKYIENDGRAEFEYISPIYAEKTPQRDCTICHQVTPGTPMGIVKIRVDLTKMKRSQQKASSIIVFVLIGFSLVLAYFLRRMLMPIARSNECLQDVVDKARRGDFSGRQQIYGNDEIAQVGKITNELMATLQKSFGDIINEVAKVQSFEDSAVREGNLLDHTVGIVKSMVASTQFKHTIEEDRDLDDVYTRIHQILITEFKLSRFSFYEVIPESSEMRIVFKEGLDDQDAMWCAHGILKDETLCRSRRTAQTITSIDDKLICPSFTGNVVQQEYELFHVCIPVILSGRADGIFQIVYSIDEKDNIHKNLHAIRTYLSDAAPVIESKRLMKILKESTLRDPMTGLNNRRFLEQYQTKMVSLAQRQENKLQIIMCDLDHFKETNDTYGHQIGDIVLIEVAKILVSSIRKSDFVIRYGGEEFLIVLVDTDQGMLVAEKIRSALAAKQFMASGEAFYKTMSMGISLFPDDSDDFTECIGFADIALYQAKEQGRDRAITYEAGMQGE